MNGLEEVTERAARVLDACRTASVRSGRPEDAVALVAACKTQPRERALAVLDAGVRHLGENRVQEAEEKWAEGVPGGAELHLIGTLQRNKARRAVSLFETVQSCDSVALARRLSDVADSKPMHVLLEVNVSGEASKSGFAPDELRREIDEVLALPNLVVDGLMTIAPLAPSPEHARPVFRSLRELSEELRGCFPSLGGELSMGMTDDYEVAIAEGSTMVRVGRAIYGRRA